MTCMIKLFINSFKLDHMNLNNWTEHLENSYCTRDINKNNKDQQVDEKQREATLRDKEIKDRLGRLK